MKTRSWILSVAVASLGSCAHNEPMTGDEHRAAAEVAEHKAALERSQYDPNAEAHVVTPRVPITDIGVDSMRAYNPTQEHLVEADRQMKIAFQHLQNAGKLEASEDAACVGIPGAERVSCPVMAPFIEEVSESREGVTLQLKPAAPALRLVSQMRCHLAFAKATDFDRVPCPLYIKGVTINLREGRMIDIFSPDAKVAADVRREARRMFGEAQVPVALGGSGVR